MADAKKWQNAKIWEETLVNLDRLQGIMKAAGHRGKEVSKAFIIDRLVNAEIARLEGMTEIKRPIINRSTSSLPNEVLTEALRQSREPVPQPVSQPPRDDEDPQDDEDFDEP